MYDWSKGKPGFWAKVVFTGEDTYFTRGQQVFVREVREDGVVIQDPYDRHIRCLVATTDLEVTGA